jgi:hypothetical protein
LLIFEETLFFKIRDFTLKKKGQHTAFFKKDQEDLLRKDKSSMRSFFLFLRIE